MFVSRTSTGMGHKINSRKRVRPGPNAACGRNSDKFVSSIPEMVVDRPGHGFRNAVDLHEILDRGA